MDESQTMMNRGNHVEWLFTQVQYLGRVNTVGEWCAALVSVTSTRNTEFLSQFIYLLFALRAVIGRSSSAELLHAA